MLSEADVINRSTLTKFRRQRLKDTNLLDLLINKTESIAVLRERSTQLRKAVYVYQ